jgi:2-iminobutanoate/2-iminopropanoate deaminase
MRDVVHTDSAPAAVGPYSQAIVAGGWVWASGQIGLDPATGEMVPGGVADQARQSLTNLIALLAAAGSGPERVVRTTVYLTDMEDYAEVNAVYAEFFADSSPARACVAVAGLPKGARVEIDAVALS